MRIRVQRIDRDGLACELERLGHRLLRVSGPGEPDLDDPGRRKAGVSRAALRIENESLVEQLARRGNALPRDLGELREAAQAQVPGVEAGRRLEARPLDFRLPHRR